MSSAPYYKTKKFWIVLFFSIYSIFGWLVTPYIVKQQTINTLKDIANWNTKIESVVFNPYALSLAIHGFEAKDEFEHEAISFERLFVNFSILSSLTGQVAFDEISLIKPLVNAQLDKNGISNFERDFIQEQVKTEPVENESSEPLALFFKFISISQGQVNFSDYRTDETFTLKFEPLNLALHDFSTDQNDGGDYKIRLSLGNEQELDWQGRIGIAPFSSKGSFILSNLRSSSFWHYAKPYSPYALQNALISLQASYDTEFSDNTSRLVVDSASISIEGLKLAEEKHDKPFFELEALNLSPIGFNLEKRKVSLGKLEIQQPQLYAIKNKQSEINLLRPLEKHAANTGDSNSEETLKESGTNTDSSDEAFRWFLGGIELRDGNINWTDNSLESEASVNLDQIDLTLGSISHELDKPFTYKLNFNTGASQQVVEGNLAALPLKLEGKLALSAVPLTWLQPYIGEQLNIQLDEGLLSLSSQYNLALNNKDLTGEITANTSIDQLALKDDQATQSLAGFQSFEISGLDLKLHGQQQAPSLIIDEVKLSKPYSQARISESGEMNLAQISKEKEKQNNDNQESTEEASLSPNIAIRNIIIEEGRFDYTDASLNPVFNTFIDQFTGNISNISSDIDAHSKVALSGNLDSYGKITIDGTSNPLSAKPNTSLKVQVSNIDLTTGSPYSGKYAGYLIDKGKLDLDLSYDINGSKLKADNEVFINQFNFGDSVDSPDATALPLPLAIGIMKNLDGEIDINLPISGDLSDPSFSIGGVLLTAFTNLITKIVTSPFSILGSLVEGSDDISSVNFAAASAVLSEQESNKVLKLAEALKKRPNLSLEIRGIADRTLDRSAEKQALSEEKLAILAKNRALFVSKVLIEQGDIPEQRIFTLEPKIETNKTTTENNASNELLPTVPSVFTIKIN